MSDSLMISLRETLINGPSEELEREPRKNKLVSLYFISVGRY